MGELQPYLDFFLIYEGEADKRRAMIEMFKTIIDDDKSTTEQKITGVNNFTLAYLTSLKW
jgi:hypothetical protein